MDANYRATKRIGDKVMTIEEIKKASDELFKSFRCGKTYRMGFETGVMWSDEHLQVPKIISKSMKITREEAKELLPIVKALAEGKMIQDKIEGLTGWVDTDEINLEYNGQKIKHRIKPEIKYRPFKSQEECWSEMLKHQPFGWVKDEYKYVHIVCVHKNEIEFSPDEDNDGNLFTSTMDFTSMCEKGGYTFADGTPFGIKEE